MRNIFIYLFVSLSSILLSCNDNVYYISEFGLTPNSGVDATPYVAEAIATIAKENGGEPATLYFDEGDYDFYPQNANERELYISNHDQLNPKKIALILEGISNLTIDGQGANFYMNGRMLPIVMDSCNNCVIKNISIDTRVPQITQITIVENNIKEGFVIYRLFPGTNYKIDDAKRLITYGDGWEIHPIVGIAFDGNTRHIIYQTSDIAVGTENVEELEPYLIKAPWKNQKLKNGDIVVLRNYERPTPGIFVNDCKNLILNDVNIHYAEGMGLLAQLSENIILKGLCVSIREGSNRYFTTQADATHFSACMGDIISVNGMYEGMMDDAINVHGTYLKILERIDSLRVIASYMHPQAYGFYWGGSGDSVQFVKSSTMEIISENVVESIRPYDKECVKGAKLFEIQFKDTLMAEIDNSGYGIENLEWTPTVYFADNTIRNNRARGALFSTPKNVTVERNLFDHTSGTAILLCGDCNGWFETGACRNVIIRNNHFINALTNMFQFTNAIISIYPEIPDLKYQKKYFHGGEGRGVVIEKNTFETFDRPIVYAKSLDGMTFRDNTVIDNNDYEPFHWNKYRFLFDRVINVSIGNNNFLNGFDETKDVCYGN